MVEIDRRPPSLAEPRPRHQPLVGGGLHRAAVAGTRRGVRAPAGLPRHRGLRAAADDRLPRDAPVPALPGARCAPRGRRHRTVRVRPVACRHGDHGSVSALGRRSAPRRGHLPEAVPGTRTADRGDRRRDGAVHPPPRPQGAHEQPHRGRDRGGRRRLLRGASRAAWCGARGRHPELHRGVGRRGAADGPPPAVPLPRGGRPAGRSGHPHRRRPAQPCRSRSGKPADRRDDGDRGRRFRGRRPPDEPRPRRSRPGAAGLADATDAAREAGGRDAGRRTVANHEDRRHQRGLAQPERRSGGRGRPRGHR